MEIPPKNARIPEEAKFQYDDDSMFAVIETTTPMVQPLGLGAVNNNVALCFDSISFSISNTEDKLLVEIVNDSLGDEESASLLYVPLAQIQELFDWLKKHGKVK